MKKVLAALLALVVCAAMPSAQGQGPTTPQATVSVTGVPETMKIVPLGESASVTFQVSLAFAGVVCPQASTAKVQLSMQQQGGGLAGLSASLDKSELTFDVPANVLPFGGGSPAPPQDVTLTASASTSVTPDHHHVINVTATYAGGAPSGCQSASTIAAASDVGEIMFMTGSVAAPSGSATTGPGVTTTAGEAGKSSPGPAVFLLLAALGALAFVRRRR